MDEDRNQSPLEEPQAPKRPIGHLFRSRREEKSLALDTVAKRLHLDPGIIEALEADDFDSLPGPAYIRGYIRAYSQLLELEPKPLLDAYEQLAQPVVPELKPASNTTDPMTTMRGRTYAIGSALALTLILLAAWWYSHGQSPKPNHTAVKKSQSTTTHQVTGLHSSSESTVSPANSGQKNTLTTGNTKSTGNAPENPSVSAVPKQPDHSSVAIKSSPTSASASKPTAKPKTPIVDQSHIILTLSHRSWVQIEDANGKRLVYGLLSAGTKRQLTGKPPFSVFLGYAQGVNIEINGKTVNFNAHIRANHTARFKVSKPSSKSTSKTSP
ncbi:helix-turn-helix domain-containing protein [Acidihalobacter prosperus]